MDRVNDSSHFHLAGEAPTAGEVRIAAATVALLRSLLSCATGDAESAQLHFEIGALLGHPLRDAQGALEALRAAWRLQPEARHVARAYHRAARRAEAWDDLMAALEAEARLETFGPHRAALLTEFGELLESRSRNRKAAAAAYLAAVEAHPPHVAALTALERLAIEDQDWVQAGNQADQLARACTTAELRAEFEARAAQHLHRGGEVARALALAAQAQMRAPRSWSVQLRVEALLSREGNWTDLVALRRAQISQGDVPPAEGWFDVGVMARYRLNDSALAIEAFREAARLAEAGSRAVALAELAPLLEADEDWAALIDVLDERLKLESDTARQVELHYQMARIHEDKRHDLEKAADAYERALDLDRSYLPALQGAGRLFQRLGWSDRLLRMHRLELEVTSQPARQRAETLRRCAQVLLEREDSTDEAIRLLVEARSLAPQHLAYFLALEGVYARVGAWQDLAQLYQQELDQTNDAGRRGWLLIALGVVAADRLGDRPRAIAAFKEAGEHPESGHRYILERLARLLEDQREPEPLIEVLRKLAAFTQDPAQVATLFERIAAVEEQLGRVDDAIGTFKQALDVAPPTHPVFVSAGRLFLRASRYPEMVEMHRRAAEVAEPAEKVSLLLKSAEILVRYLNDPDGALEKLQQARVIDPTNPVTLSRLRHQLRLGARWQELRATLTQADVEPGSCVQRAMLAEGGGDDSAASELYQQALTGADIAALARLRMLFSTGDWSSVLESYRAQSGGFLARCRAAAIACEQLGDTAPILEVAVAHPDDLPALVLAWPYVFSESLSPQLLPLLAERLPDPLLRGAAQERLLAARIGSGSVEEALELRGRLLASSQWNPVLLVMQEVLFELKYARAVLARVRKELAEVQGADVMLRAASSFSAGLLFEEIGSRREAISALEAAISLGASTRWITAHLFLVRFCQREGDDQRSGEALRGLAAALPPCSERAVCLRLLATQLAGGRDLTGAVVALEEALGANPSDLRALQQLAGLLTEASQPERLIAHLQRAFEAEKEPEVAVCLGVGLALRLFRAGRRLPARAAIRRVLAIAPESLEARAVAADLAVAAERWQEAVGALTAIAAHPQAPPMLRAEVLARQVAIQVLHLRDLEAARSAGAELPRCTDDRRAVPLQLAVARILGDEQAMLAALEALVLSEELGDEERSDYQIRLAELKAGRLGDRAGAIATLGAVRSRGRKQQALQRILELAGRSDHWLPAADAIEEAFRDGQTDPALEVSVRQELAAHLEAEQPEAAIRQYERVVNIDPEQVGALERLAELTTRGHPQKAIEHHRSLLERTPGRFGVYRTLRKLFLAVGHDDAAFLCEAILEGLGCADEEERYFYRQRRANLGKELEGNLEAEERALLFPEQDEPAFAVLAALEDHVHQVLSVDLEAYACLPEGSVPPAVQLGAERLAQFLGAPSFRLLVSGAHQPVIEPGAPAVLILPRAVLEAPRRTLHFTLGGMLGRLAGHAACTDPHRAAPLTGGLLEQLLWAACEVSATSPECPHRGRPIFEDLVRRLRAAAERQPELLARLQPACERLVALLPGLSGEGVLGSLERAALRTSLLVAQDPAVAIAGIRAWREQQGSGQDLSPDVLQALVFVVSAPHLELRRRRSLGLCA